MSQEPRLITKAEMIDRVRKVITRDYSGNRTKFSRDKGVSASYVGWVVRGKQSPGPKFLKAIGYEKVVAYRRVE